MNGTVERTNLDRLADIGVVTRRLDGVPENLAKPVLEDFDRARNGMRSIVNKHAAILTDSGLTRRERPSSSRSCATRR